MSDVHIVLSTQTANSSMVVLYRNIINFPAKMVVAPRIQTDNNGGSVDKNHLVRLAVDTDRARIYYTLDGYTPDMHKFGLKVLYAYNMFALLPKIE